MAKVLVVDDSTTVLLSLKRLLEENGHDVLAAKDGLSTLSTMITNPPDIILLDIGLPGLSGLDLCVAIRRMPGCEHLPVIVITGSQRQFDEVMAQRIGVEGYLQKPVNPTQLLDMIAELTRNASPSDVQAYNLGTATIS
jgi:DNA-binding response OmpR family regulator